MAGKARSRRSRKLFECPNMMAVPKDPIGVHGEDGHGRETSRGFARFPEHALDPPCNTSAKMAVK